MGKVIRKVIVLGLVLLLTTMTFGMVPMNVSGEGISTESGEGGSTQVNITVDGLSEFEEMRDLWSKTYVDSNGDYIAELSAEPIHYYDFENDRFEDINTTIMQQVDGSYTNFDNLLLSKFPSNTGEYVQITNRDFDKTTKFKTISMGFDSESGIQNEQTAQASKAEVLVNEIKYTNVFTQTTEQYLIMNGEIKRNFVLYDLLNSPSDSDYLQIVTEYVIGDLNVYVNDESKESDFSTADEIQLRDPVSGEVIFILFGGIAFDSIGNSTSLSYDVEFNDNGSLKVIINTPVDWLETAVYPVTIDPPVTISLYPPHRGYTYKYSPWGMTYYRKYSTNYNYIGTSGYSYKYIYRPFWQWDTSSIPDDCTITGLKFKASTNTYGCTISFYLRHMNYKPQNSGASTVWSDCGDGNIYASGTFYYGQISLNLGGTSVSDFQNQLGSNWFAMGGHSRYEYSSCKGYFYYARIYVTYQQVNQPPVADAGAPYTGNEGVTITFDASGSMDPHGDALQYRWDFNNDGTYDTTWSSSPTVCHTWADEHSGTAKVEVFDGEYYDTDTASVTVNNVAPCVFAGADKIANRGDIVSFCGTFTDRGILDTHTIQWDFGDDDTAEGTLTPTNVYTEKGTFTATLTITDNDGGVGTDTLKVNVITPTADAGFDHVVDEGDEVHCDGSESIGSILPIDVEYGVYLTVGPSTEQTVVKVASDGTELMRIPKENLGVSSANGLDLNPVDGTIWVWDYYGGKVAHLSADGTSVLASWNAPIYIKKIEIDPVDGGVWLSPDYEPYLYKYSVDGTLLYKIRSLSTYSHFSPYISVSPQENAAWIADYHADKVVKIKSDDGSVILSKSGITGIGISVDQSDGSVWVADYGHNEVVKLDINGNELVRVNVGSSPTHIKANPEDGGAWVSFFTAGPLKRLDSNGNIIATSQTFSIGGWAPFDLAPGGEVWAAENSLHSLHKLSPNGELIHTITDPDNYKQPNTVAIFPPIQHQSIIDPNVVALWHMNEGSGGIIFDETSNHNDGTINGATWTSEGKFDTALNFDGVDDFVRVHGSSTLPLDGKLTIGAWVYFTGIQGSDYQIVDKGWLNFALRLTNSRPALVIGDNSNYDIVYADFIITQNQWHYIAGVYDNANDYAAVYYDSNLVAEDNSFTMNMVQGDKDLHVGRMSYGEWQYWDGKIDEVILYNRALSAQEILDYYNSNAEHFSPELGDPLNIISYEWDFESDETYDYQETAEDAPDGAFDGQTTHSYGDNGAFTVTLRVTDERDAVDTDTCTVTVNNVAPKITLFTGSLEPFAVGAPVTMTGDFTDPGFLDTHTAKINWGDETTTSAAVTKTPEGGTISGTHHYSNAGVYRLTLTVTDDDGDSDSVEWAHYIVVYDPTEGFVTGGGWIDSPAEAFTADTLATGKASFGFVSKYKKGADVPEGNTEFQFKAGSLNFHSNDYDWLVIAGSKAMFKGTGTINGEGTYKFLISANDGALGGDGTDMFRIKIWLEAEDDTENVIYDNQIGAEDDADLADMTIIKGGSIVIHKK